MENKHIVKIKKMSRSNEANGPGVRELRDVRARVRALPQASTSHLFPSIDSPNRGSG